MPTSTSPDIPLDYVTPPFPSLYWPINTPAGASYYLYYQSDIWRFTLYWTLITFGAVHLATSSWAVLMQIKQETGVGESWEKGLERAARRRSKSTSRRNSSAGGGGRLSKEGGRYDDDGGASSSSHRYPRQSSTINDTSNSSNSFKSTKEEAIELTETRSRKPHHHPQEQRRRSHRHPRSEDIGRVGFRDHSTDRFRSNRRRDDDDDNNSSSSSSDSNDDDDDDDDYSRPSETIDRGSKRVQAWRLRWVWLIPVIYCTIGSIEAMMAGTVVGAILGTVYQAGYFKMSTWTPLVWALINVLVLVVSSFSIQGGL